MNTKGIIDPGLLCHFLTHTKDILITPCIGPPANDLHVTTWAGSMFMTISTSAQSMLFWLQSHDPPILFSLD